jgi:hypothetical protein
MTIFGFFDQKKNESELRFVFLSQVMFQVTATVLEDYFKQQIKNLELEE